MPDFCSNSIKIVGPRDKIQALWTNVQKDQDEGGGLLRGLRPEPNYEETPVPLIHPEVSALFARDLKEWLATMANQPAIRGDSWRHW